MYNFGYASLWCLIEHIIKLLSYLENRRSQEYRYFALQIFSSSSTKVWYTISPASNFQIGMKLHVYLLDSIPQGYFPRNSKYYFLFFRSIFLVFQFSKLSVFGQGFFLLVQRAIWRSDAQCLWITWASLYHAVPQCLPTWKTWKSQGIL